MKYTTDFGTTWAGGSPTTGSLDNIRRIYDFSGVISELNVNADAFFVYLSKLAKSPVNDPIFKNLEERSQWQRRTMFSYAKKTLTFASATTFASSSEVLQLSTYYDKFGRKQTTEQTPEFLLKNQIVVLNGTYSDGSHSGLARLKLRITNDSAINTTGSNYAELTVVNGSTMYVEIVELVALQTIGSYSYGDTITPANTHTFEFSIDSPATVEGTAFNEGNTEIGDSWNDELTGVEGYTQIFTTFSPMFSGTALATELRGKKDEFMRIWKKKLLEHRDDISRAVLFGTGFIGDTTNPRKTWGIARYIEKYGNVFEIDASNVSYDTFLEIMEYLTDVHNGSTTNNKLVVCSTKWIRFLNSLGGFIGSISSGLAQQLDVQNIKGRFGHNLTTITTAFGTFTFVADAHLSNIYEDLAIVVDLGNVKYRPLKGNGISRDTFIKTNIQTNATDGRVDKILTEAGLQINLIETHAMLKLKNFASNSYISY